MEHRRLSVDLLAQALRLGGFLLLNPDLLVTFLLTGGPRNLCSWTTGSPAAWGSSEYLLQNCNTRPVSNKELTKSFA